MLLQTPSAKSASRHPIRSDLCALPPPEPPSLFLLGWNSQRQSASRHPSRRVSDPIRSDPNRSEPMKPVLAWRTGSALSFIGAKLDPRISIDFQRFPMEFYGFPWFPMLFNDFTWISNGFSKILYGFQIWEPCIIFNMCTFWERERVNMTTPKQWSATCAHFENVNMWTWLHPKNNPTPESNPSQKDQNEQLLTRSLKENHNGFGV